MTTSDKKQLPFQITGSADIEVINRHIPNFNFGNPVTKTGYDLVKRVIAKKIEKPRGYDLIKYNKENKITVGCMVEEIRTGYRATVSTINKDGRLVFKGYRRGAHSPIHWKLHQSAGGTDEKEKE